MQYERRSRGLARWDEPGGQVRGRGGRGGRTDVSGTGTRRARDLRARGEAKGRIHLRIETRLKVRARGGNCNRATFKGAQGRRGFKDWISTSNEAFATRARGEESTRASWRDRGRGPADGATRVRAGRNAYAQSASRACHGSLRWTRTHGSNGGQKKRGVARGAITAEAATVRAGGGAPRGVGEVRVARTGAPVVLG